MTISSEFSVAGPMMGTAHPGCAHWFPLRANRIFNVFRVIGFLFDFAMFFSLVATPSSAFTQRIIYNIRRSMFDEYEGPPRQLPGRAKPADRSYVRTFFHGMDRSHLESGTGRAKISDGRRHRYAERNAILERKMVANRIIRQDRH